MPALDALREAFPDVPIISEQMLTSPFFHLGVIGSYLPLEEKERLRLSLDVITDALREWDQARLVSA